MTAVAWSIGTLEPQATVSDKCVWHVHLAIVATVRATVILPLLTAVTEAIGTFGATWKGL